ncbi:glycosyltransferase family 4 protein [Aestuariivita boseongensis]|uniref:glycosyltransferase family 4 protein n=1 Tax=Aestuariivita boseongensis TaxID=1470562 RepID=UPI000681CD77|nr:glycosyltransferase family 4 protein [Aestuariivita boseongensis]
MRFLFVHQNMPGQYREVIQWLGASGDHQIVFLTQRKECPSFPGVKTVRYSPHHKAANDTYGLSKVWENATGAGFGAAMAAEKLKEAGFSPDIIIGHTGWGEMLFLKQVWPDVPVLGLFEYFYRASGGSVGFDPEEPMNDHAPFLLEARNAVPYAALHQVDRGIVPTIWQRDRFPDSFHDKLHVLHDGIRTDKLMPDPDVRVRLGRLDRDLTREDEIVTYVARNMERTRGFHQFMRALPRILEARPNARVIAIGGNDTSYGQSSKHPGGLRGEMEEEVGHLIDWSRVHFVGRVPYAQFCRILQLSRCHIYLTMPFVLSWSLMEAMAMEATIVTSDVAPVREVVEHGKTGLLVDFFDPAALADQVAQVLEAPSDFSHLGVAARAHVVDRYDFLTKSLPGLIDHINALVPAGKALSL